MRDLKNKVLIFFNKIHQTIANLLIRPMKKHYLEKIRKDVESGTIKKS